MPSREEVKEYFTSQGCQLLEEYQHCMKPMSYICKCGRQDSKCWNKFKSRGDRCGFCHSTGRKKKHSFEEVKSLFQARGCELLESEYKNLRIPMSYRCGCGRISKICLSAFKHQHQNCYECGLDKNRGEKNHMWIGNRETKKYNDGIRKRCYSMLRKSLERLCKNKTQHTEYMLGYSPKQLQEHVKTHPNWEEVKDGEWHLDHIFPVAAFIERGIEDVKIINHLDNLQPLEGGKNISKGDIYDKQAFEEWLKKHGA